MVAVCFDTKNGNYKNLPLFYNFAARIFSFVFLVNFEKNKKFLKNCLNQNLILCQVEMNAFAVQQIHLL